jgi:glycosyltransferase involved in cell wall biosynthesis
MRTAFVAPMIARVNLASNTDRRRTVAIDFRGFDELSGGGQFRYCIDLINGLSAADSEFRFLVLGTKPEPIPQIANAFRENVHFSYASIPRFAGRGRLYADQLRYFVWLRQKPVSLLHALHTFLPIASPVPLVATVYDLMFELFPEYEAITQSREYRLYRWSFQRSVSRAIAISATTADDVARLWKFPHDRISVVHLSSDNFGPGTETEESDGLTIFSPYNLEPRKNLATLLKAVSEIQARGISARLLLFGRAAVNAEREIAFQKEVKDLGIDSSVCLTGVVSDADLNRLLHSATMFVFPTLYEGFGLPVLEAMRAGSLVVCHKASAMAEVLGDAGIKVDMTDTKALADALEAGYRNREMRREFKRLAMVRGQEFSTEKMVRQTLEVYREALA